MLVRAAHQGILARGSDPYSEFCLSTHRTKASDIDVLRYPDRPAAMLGPPGTNMFFVCRGKPIGDAELQACFPPPPSIPDDVFLQLQCLSTVVPMGHIPPHSPEAEAAAKAGDYMVEIDARLRRHFEGVRAVAFTVRGPGDERESD
jgi:hypothetical protein